MCFIDNDEPTFCESEDRTARKEHRCCECRVIIGRGENNEYEEWVLKPQNVEYRCNLCGGVVRFDGTKPGVANAGH